jgi:hypothetical protein
MPCIPCVNPRHILIDFNTALLSLHLVFRTGGKEERYSLEVIHANLVEFNRDLLTSQVISIHYFRGSLEPEDLILWTATTHRLMKATIADVVYEYCPPSNIESFLTTVT